MIDIRPFLEADAPAVLALWHDVFAYTSPHNQPEASLRRKLAEQPELLFVALADGELVGTVMGGYDGHRGWIYSLAVRPDVRGRGIGTALMRHVEQAFAGRGCPKINLQIMPSNAQAVAFYRGLGFVVEERVSMGKVL